MLRRQRRTAADEGPQLTAQFFMDAAEQAAADVAPLSTRISQLTIFIMSNHKRRAPAALRRLVGE